MKKILQCLILSLLLITIFPSRILAEGEGAFAYSEKDGTKTYYYSINDAMNASRRDLTIIMAKDWQTTSPIDIVEGTTSKIEMNGYRIKRSGGSDTSHTGEVFTMHPNSSLYLSGNLKKETSFTFKLGTYSIDPTYTITSGGLITGGYTYNGGAIYMKKKAKLYLDNVAISGNEANNDGGGIFVNNEDCEIYMSNNAQISYNKAGDGGGIYSDADGTHIHMSNGSSIYKNHASSDGGGIYFNYSWFTLDNESGTASIHDNSSYDCGGAIFVETKNKGSNNGRISGLDIYNNSSIGSGGALYLRQKNITIKNCTIKDNIAAKHGGGIYNANDNRIENTTITGNKSNYQKTYGTNYEGGGIYSVRSNDITLSGKIIIKDNLRMNELEENITDTYFIGHSGWRDDDIFLYTSDAWALYAYVIADNVDSSSLVGLYTDVENKDRLLVKNLSSFSYGHTFFLDDATSSHVGYIASDSTLWQRTGTTQYSLIINGVERERIDFRGTSLTYDATKADMLFDYWEVEGVNLTDAQIKNPQIHIDSMPSRDVILTAHYSSDKKTENGTLTVNAPALGAPLPEKGTFSWIDNTSGKDVVRQMEVNVTWKSGNEIVSGVAQDKDYKVYATIQSDTSKNLLFKETLPTIKVVYETGTSQVTGTSLQSEIDNKTIYITGDKIKAISTKFSVKNYSQKLEVGLGESLAVFLDELPKTVTAIAANGVETTLDLETPTEDQYSKFIKDGVVTQGNSSYYTVKLKIKNPNNLNINKKEISVKVTFVNQKSKVVSIPDINIDFTDGGSYVTMICMIQNKIIDAVAVDENGNEFNCKVKIKDNINSSDFSYPLKLRGFVSTSLKVDFTVRRLADDQDNTYAFYANVESQDSDIRLGENTKVKVIYNIVKKADGSSSPKLKVVKLDSFQDHSFEGKAVVDYEDENNEAIIDNQETVNEVTSEEAQNVINDLDNKEVQEETTNDTVEESQEKQAYLDSDIELYNVDETTNAAQEETLSFEIENYDDLLRDYTNVYYSIDDGEAYKCASKYITLSKVDYNTHTLRVWASNGESNSEEFEYSYYFSKDNIENGPSINLESGTYKANDESTSYDSETGDLSLNVKLTSNVEGATVFYAYSKCGDTYGDWTNGSTNNLALTAGTGETVTYKLIAWLEKDGAQSDCIERTYTLDNSTNYNKITINTTSPDGLLNDSQVLYYEKGKSFDLALPQYENYCLTDRSGIYKYSNLSIDNSDAYLLHVTNLESDVEINLTYTALITELDFDIDNLTIGKKLPSIKGIAGILADGETTIDLSNYFDLKNVSWKADGKDIGSNGIVDYSTIYKATLGIVDTAGSDSKYLFIGTPKSNLNNIGSILSMSGSGYSDHNDYLFISFNKTASSLNDEAITYTLSSIGSLSYDDITYEDALSFKETREGSTVIDNYNLPSKILVNYSSGGDYLDITWDSNFTVVFDSNNTNAQQLLIKGHVNLPSYISNPNNLDTNITLTINVQAKKIDQVSIVNKKDVISKLELTDEEKQQKDNGATIDIDLLVGNDISDEDVVLINNNLDSYTLGQTLDLTLIKTITYNGIPTEQEVYQTTSPIEVSITITDALINKTQGIEREYKVLRVHNNKVDVLDASFDSSNKTITFKTDKFSTYAIVYRDTYKNNKDSNPKEGSNLSCEEYMNSNNWTWSETKKACVYRVSNTEVK